MLPPSTDYQIQAAHTPQDFKQAQGLFQQYADWLEIDLSYQKFEQELAVLPQMYGENKGRILLAKVNDQVIGCVGVRQFSLSICEMKRLYVRPKFQGRGIGVDLAKQIIQEGRKLGYAEMVLDTLKSMTSARRLYHNLGFYEIPAYYENPVTDVIYLKLNLIK
ncbi:MAG: GNAT family N-acetyltransferase [Bacteroidota bacterium]